MLLDKTRLALVLCLVRQLSPEQMGQLKSAVAALPGAKVKAFDYLEQLVKMGRFTEEVVAAQGLPQPGQKGTELVGSSPS